MIQKSDWVTTKSAGGIGIVKRVAKDGSWADVMWRSNSSSWTKRMKTDHLDVLVTIPLGNGYTVTDLNREQELKEVMTHA